MGLSLVMYGCAVWWGLPTLHGGWAPDAVGPYVVLSPDRWNLAYPPFHRYVLFVLYSPAWLLQHWGWLDTEALWPNTLLIGLGRMLSVVMTIATVSLTYITAHEIFERDRPAIFTTLMAIFIVPLVYYGKTLNLEAPYLFWFAIALLGYVRILKYHRQIDYFLFSTAAVLSVCTKDQAYGLYILPTLYLVIDFLNAKKAKTFSSKVLGVFDQRLWLPVLSGVLLFALIHQIGWGTHLFSEHLESLKSASYEANQFLSRPENTLREHWKLWQTVVRQTIFSQGWPVFLTSVAGVGLALLGWFLHHSTHRLLIRLLIPVLSYYLFFISVILYSRDRFLIPICLILSYFGAFFLEALCSIWARHWLPKAIAIGILAYSFFYAFSVNVLMLQDSRYVAEQWMRENVAAPATVGYTSWRVYQPRFHTVPSDTIKSISIGDIADCAIAGELDYVVTTSAYDLQRFPPETSEYQHYTKLYGGQTPFQEVFRYQARPKWNLIRPELPDAAEYYDSRFKAGNLNKINPEIRIFQRQTSIDCPLASLEEG